MRVWLDSRLTGSVGRTGFNLSAPAVTKRERNRAQEK
jgi:hypothetical protein